MRHKFDAAGYCQCGVRRLDVPGHKRGWYVDAAGLFQGNKMPLCTRTRRRRLVQLKLFPVVANGNGGKDNG